MNLIPWEPFREMEQLFRQYSPLLGRRASSADEGGVDWRPMADVSETDTEYLVKAQLPGVRKEDVKITIQDGILSISGERKQTTEQKNEKENALRVESFYGMFSRSFALPDNVDARKVQAEAKDGVLTIHVPKTESQSKQPISIQVQ